MNPYRETTLAHLAEYKRTQLGVSADGRWHHDTKPYAHFLPEDQRELNILPHIRADFWAFAASAGIRLHRDFHHLTSLQAFAFNLFFPFRGAGAEARAALARALGLSDVQITDVHFDVVLDLDKGLAMVAVKLTEDALVRVRLIAHTGISAERYTGNGCGAR